MMLERDDWSCDIIVGADDELRFLMLASAFRTLWLAGEASDLGIPSFCLSYCCRKRGPIWQMAVHERQAPIPSLRSIFYSRERLFFLQKLMVHNQIEYIEARYILLKTLLMLITENEEAVYDKENNITNVNQWQAGEFLERILFRSWYVCNEIEKLSYVFVALAVHCVRYRN